jgi:Spy/CpxP family protein refolding chaperone
MNVLAQTEQTPDPTVRGPVAKGRAGLNQDMPDRRLNLMTRNLGLTKEQQQKIKPILEEEASQLDLLRGDDSYNRDERRAKLQQLNELTYEKVKPLLTQDQQKKHEMAKQIIKDKRSKQRDTKAGQKMTTNDPDSRLARLTQDLGLTKEQQDKIKPILQDEFIQLEKLPGNDTLNRDQRRIKLQQLNDETYAKIAPVLTPEQKKKHDEIRQKISERRSLKKSKAPVRNPANP